MLRTLTGHTAALKSAQFSDDGGSLLTASEDRTARIWDVSSGALRQTLKGHTAAVNTVSLSKNGRLIVTASADKTARVWDVASGSSPALPRAPPGKALPSTAASARSGIFLLARRGSDQAG